MSTRHCRFGGENSFALFSSILTLVLVAFVSATGCGRPVGAPSDSATRASTETEAATTGRTDNDQPVTFTKQIAPLVFEHCTPCHRPGQVAPFSLLSYHDLKSRAEQIADVTESRYMPPWKPEPGHGEFFGSRRIDNQKVRLFRQWVEEGTPEGDPADLPPKPEYRDGWLLGTPDLVVQMSEAYMLPAGDGDLFRSFVLPIPTDRVRYVHGVECRPTNAQVIHHADIVIDPTDHSRELDALDPQPGFQGMRPIESVSVGFLTGWAPGATPLLYSDDLTWRLDPASDLVLTLHMLPTGKPESVDFKLGFHFSEKPPKRPAYSLRLVSTTIDIPAGVSNYAVEDSYVLPVDIEAVGLRPHAHYLGKQVDATATKPDGTVVPLILIKDWDFNWQDDYRFKEPLFLPQGTCVSMRFSYDNSAENVRNPNSPPQRVTWGAKSSDEMAQVLLQVLPFNAKDYHQLALDLQKRSLHDRILGYEASLGTNRDDSGVHSSLNYYYEISREKEEIADRLEAAVRATPKDPYGRYCLAAVRNLLGDRQAALQQYEELLKIDPDYNMGRYYYAKSLRTLGRFGEAVTELNRVVEALPDLYDVHVNLGLSLRGTGSMDEAADCFSQALKINPKDFTSQFQLGSINAERKQWKEAELWFRKALAEDPQHVMTLVNLGVALQNLGQIDNGIDFLQQALRADPDSWQAHACLASCYQIRKDINAALDHYQEVVRINPNIWPVRMRLGSLWMSVNDPQQAVAHFVAVTQGEPTFANAHLQAAVAFNTMGQLEEALIHYRAATQLKSNWLPATGGLAWILATHADERIRDPNEAIRLIEPLTQGNKTHPVALDILAAAYAARGEFELAARTADRAHLIAKAAKMAIADRIAERAKLYRQKEPYVENSRPTE